MSKSKDLPWDKGAEESLLGALLLSKQACMVAIDELMLRTDEFFSMPHQEIFAAIRELWNGGQDVDPVTVANALRRNGSGVETGHLLELQNATPTISSVDRYTQIVRELAVVRRMISFGSGTIEAAYDRSKSVEHLMQSATDGLASVMISAEQARGVIPGLYGAPSQLLAGQTIDEVNPWVVERCMRAGESGLIVAGPGAGKSSLLRQFAYCVANGIHPFTAARVKGPPKRALLVELEAPKHSVWSFGQRLLWDIHLRLGCQVSDLSEPTLWHRQGGIDIRNPVDRALFISVLRETKPDLVCIGPLKYLFAPRPGELADQTAVEVQKILVGLQERFGFALLIEAHANKSNKLQPSGSERWADWPSWGVALDCAEDLFRASASALFDVIPFRIPRNEDADIPPKLLRNMKQTLPWFVEVMTEIEINSALRRDGLLEDEDPSPRAHPV